MTISVTGQITVCDEGLSNPTIKLTKRRILITRRSGWTSSGGSHMEQAVQTEVTPLLEALGRGDASAFDKLFPLVYQELRALAHRQRRRLQGDDTLNTTALVHEAYLKLVTTTA